MFLPLILMLQVTGYAPSTEINRLDDPVTLEHIPAANIRSAELSGTSHDGAPFLLRIHPISQGAGGGWLLQLESENTLPATLRIDARRFPGLDLSTLRVRSGNGRFRVVIKFGDPRPNCFRREDGRNRLEVYYDRGVLSDASIATYNNCSPIYEDITEGV